MNAFTKTQYDWKEAYIFVVHKLEDGEFAMDKTIRELAGCFAVSNYLNDQAYGDTTDNQLATLFFDRAGGLTFSWFESLAGEEQEKQMIMLMQIKFAMALVYGYDRADKCFLMWKEGEHDT